MLGYTSDDLDKWTVSLDSVLNRPGTDKEDVTNLFELLSFLQGLWAEGYFD